MAQPTKFSRFTRATDEDILRVIANSAGEPGSGKSRWWMGAPPPICFLSFDGGLEGVLNDYLKENPGKEIYLTTYDLGLIPDAESDEPPEYTQEMAVELREKVLKDYNQAIRDGAKTVVLDKESDFWRECSYAEFGPPKTGNPKDWDALKDVERKMVAMARASGINLGMIQSLKNEWKSQVNKGNGKTGIAQTGVRIPAGHDEIDYLMFHNLMHSRIERKNEDGLVEVSYGIHVHKSHSREVQGQEYENVSFVEMAQLMFPTSTEEDWL